MHYFYRIILNGTYHLEFKKGPAPLCWAFFEFLNFYPYKNKVNDAWDRKSKELYIGLCLLFFKPSSKKDVLKSTVFFVC